MSDYTLGNTDSLPSMPNIEFVVGNDSIPVGPNPVTHAISIIGNSTQGVGVTNTAPYTETITVASATTSQLGVVELATDVEILAGTSTTVVTTPSNITAKLGVQTLNGIAYGQGTTAALAWTSAENNGVLITSNTGVPSLLANSSTPGYLLTANAGAPPSWQQPATGLLSWIDETSTFTAAVNTGYFVSALPVAVLPASPSQGNSVGFIVTDASSFIIYPNVGQFIVVGVNSSSEGTGDPLGGSCDNAHEGDSIEFIYQAASSTWYTFTAPVGTWEVA